MEKKCREFYAHSSPQDSIYVAGPKNTERFNYPVEIDPGYEPQRSAEDEFLSLILWRLVELSLWMSRIN
jgi:hypothetical protein